ncbi:MAG: endolytic transglycosylase MltG [Bacteroidota bacterium]|nr:endolytic transglycosylase MltG [Bacteroidota bacterium]
MVAGKKKLGLIIGIPAGVLVILASVVAIVLYSWIYSPALVGMPEDEGFLFVQTGSDYNDLLENIDTLQWLKNSNAFDWVAQKKNLPAHISPGRYSVFKGMSNDSLINLLRSGQQAELSVTFKTMRTFEYLAQVISHQLETDSASLVRMLFDTRVIDSLGFTTETWMGMFIPNTYRFFWNTDAKDFIGRMHREFNEFWNNAREDALLDIGLTKNEVMTLASIVQEETYKADEMPRVAGAYMNRLRKGMKLQADPTVIFALGDPTIRRVYRYHLSVDSPYNTYKNKGLPPGPIRIPSIQAIDACLNYEHHKYIYFCAKEDFSGYHSFAKSYTQHLRNARKYQRALNERNIK